MNALAVHRRGRPSGHTRANGAARGFTLIELMTVVSILAVLIGIIAPSFAQFLAAQQAKSLTYDLTGDLLLARNEALKRNASISVTRVGAGWEQGWTVATVATNQPLSHRNPVVQSVTVSNAPSAITFDPNGRVSAPLGTVRMTISGGQNDRCVELDPSGRVRSHTGACT